ncbi:MAG: hypothetical protein AB1477_06350 [Acidobacteriota bacterium]|jgi:hypothetical protein
MRYNPELVVRWFCRHGIRAIAEFRFDPYRRWRFDFAVTLHSWPKEKVALEVDGGIWTGGRHTRGSGFKADMEKFNRAAVLGWRILRVEPKDLCTAATIELVRSALQEKLTQ